MENFQLSIVLTPQIHFEHLLCAPKYPFTEDCPNRQERQRPLWEIVVLWEVGVRGGGDTDLAGRLYCNFNTLVRVTFTRMWQLDTSATSWLCNVPHWFTCSRFSPQFLAGECWLEPVRGGLVRAFGPLEECPPRDCGIDFFLSFSYAQSEGRQDSATLCSTMKYRPNTGPK